MAKRVTALEAQQRELFSRRFRFLYNRWKKTELAAGRKANQYELAEKLNCNKNSITQYMRQQAMPIDYTMEKICDFFHVTPEFFSTPIFDCDKPNYTENQLKQKKACDDIVSKYLVNKSFIEFIAKEFCESDLPSRGEKRDCAGADTEYAIPGSGNNSYALDPADLMFLALLQEDVKDFLRYRFFQEKERLKADASIAYGKKILSCYDKGTNSFSILANEDNVHQLYDFAMLLGMSFDDFLVMIETGEAEQIFEEYTGFWEE